MNDMSEWDVSGDETVWYRTGQLGPVSFTQTVSELDDGTWCLDTVVLSSSGVTVTAMSLPELSAALRDAQREVKYLYRAVSTGEV